MIRFNRANTSKTVMFPTALSLESRNEFVKWSERENPPEQPQAVPGPSYTFQIAEPSVNYNKNTEHENQFYSMNSHFCVFLRKHLFSLAFLWYTVCVIWNLRAAGDLWAAR